MNWIITDFDRYDYNNGTFKSQLTKPRGKKMSVSSRRPHRKWGKVLNATQTSLTKLESSSNRGVPMAGIQPHGNSIILSIALVKQNERWQQLYLLDEVSTLKSIGTEQNRTLPYVILQVYNSTGVKYFVCGAILCPSQIECLTRSIQSAEELNSIIIPPYKQG